MSRASRQDIWEPSPAELRDINPYEEARLYTTNAERERWEGLATLFGIIVSLDALERAYVREAVSEAQYEPACTRLLAQYKTIAKLVGMAGELGGDAGQARTASTATTAAAAAAVNMPTTTTRDGLPTFRDVSDFIKTYHMDHQAAAYRLRVGVPATVEHASSQSTQSSSERAKWVAETTQGFITFMDALKLKLRAKDQLHPLLSDLMSSYSRFAPTTSAAGGSNGAAGDAMGEGRAKVLHWLITLNQMKASDEVDDDQARQMLFDVEGAYSAWFRSLQA
ncbi:ESCRT-1 complex, Vps28 subunit [Acaromyces ingoldii]|uniref:Vacuolar protein sorting-associated protein 28 n=1 Tax=Acaromyces ingoldii TaxID=215250 RepID=A0A316YWC5_9BASI|nr:ESCRT-1 complex, Vps28 subunit [Acaromyces ingoldii]PWN93432.1 ESCRT-1 complex, Vps28 subunit [Acaromyces ingoldii]